MTGERDRPGVGPDPHEAPESVRLVRLLAAIGTSSPAAEMLRDTLAATADVFRADVVCVTELARERFRVTQAWTAPGIDPGRVRDWPRGPAAAEVIASGGPAVRNAVVESDLPALLRVRAGSAAAWVPLFASGDLVELLIVLRDHAYPFTSDDIGLLSVAASRLYLALEAIDRGDALERLARAGTRAGPAHRCGTAPRRGRGAVPPAHRLGLRLHRHIDNDVFKLVRFSRHRPEHPAAVAAHAGDDAAVAPVLARRGLCRTALRHR
jgi:hypothetical protein